MGRAAPAESPADGRYQLSTGCARNAHVRAGDYLFREGGDAEHFYVIMHGRVALQLHSPGTGALILYTVSDGEVLGWPWLIPPHRWPFDAQAVESASEPRA